MIQILDFTADHIEEARHIAMLNYNRERRHAPALPSIGAMPDLNAYAANSLGVSAFEKGRMVGFLCSTPAFPNAFRSTDAVGIFSPMHANGTFEENRAQIYARMYQEAGEKWRKAGVSSHTVCLYAHDRVGQEQFFRYGFGLRCIDAIRGMDEIETPPCEGFPFAELASGEFPQVFPLSQMLDRHMAASPTFILRPSDTEISFVEKAAESHSRYFAAKKGDTVIAFIKVEPEGETFICHTPGYLHITGAYCLPEYRGRGIYQNLLNFLIRTLKQEGCTCLGVDFESLNPTANGFWLKYFTAYTHSVVRRIDEHCIQS